VRHVYDDEALFITGNRITWKPRLCESRTYGTEGLNNSLL